MAGSSDQCAIGMRATQQAAIITEAARTVGHRKKSPNTIPVQWRMRMPKALRPLLPKKHPA